MDAICADDFMPARMMFIDHSEKWHINDALDTRTETPTIHRAVGRGSPATVVRMSPAWRLLKSPGIKAAPCTRASSFSPLGPSFKYRFLKFLTYRIWEIKKRPLNLMNSRLRPGWSRCAPFSCSPRREGCSVRAR